MLQIAILLSLFHLIFAHDLTVCNKTKVINKVPVYEFCHWHQIEWKHYTKKDCGSPCSLHGKGGNYIPSRNIPTKLRLFNGRAYVIIDRNVGVISSLSYFDLVDVRKDKDCPKLECFHSCARNQLALFGNCTDDTVNYLINVRDIQFTKQKRAWLLDIGVYFNDKTPVFLRAPRLCSYDVSTSQAAQERCYSFPTRLYNEANQLGLNAIVVKDNEGHKKDFVYIFNAASATIIVFSENSKKFWGIRAAVFQPEPSQSLLQFNCLDKQEFQTISHDGIFSGASDSNGLFVSAKASDDLYFIPFKTLNNKANEFYSELTYEIKEIGTYNRHGQTYDIVRNDDVLFFIQPQLQALVCANKKDRITPETLQFLSVDHDKFTHLTSIDIFHQKPNNKEIFLLSNNLVDIKLNGFSPKKKNFVVSIVDLDEVEKLYPGCLGYVHELDHVKFPWRTCTKK